MEQRTKETNPIADAAVAQAWNSLLDLVADPSASKLFGEDSLHASITGSLQALKMDVPSCEGCKVGQDVGKSAAVTAILVAAVLRGSGKGQAPGGTPSERVYRGLSAVDDPAKGLTARAPGAGNSPLSHVAGKRESQWISTTKDRATALEKYGENGVVEIDLSKVTGTIEDVSGGFPNGGRMSNWARRDQEVLIQNGVPAEAMTRIK